MDRYVRVAKSQQGDDSAAENEVRITASGYMSQYIAYATSLLTVRCKVFAYACTSSGPTLWMQVTHTCRGLCSENTCIMFVRACLCITGAGNGDDHAEGAGASDQQDRCCG